MFEHVETYPGDPILSLMDDYQRDPRAGKVNLSIGFYYDEHGEVPVLPSVRRAKALLDVRAETANLYLPMDGHPGFREAVQGYLFGDLGGADSERIVTLQSVGGSGALRVGADFLKRYYPQSQVWVSDPTWDNHLAIFQGAGFAVNRYPYLDASGQAVDFAAMLDVFGKLPAHSIVLLHACCHNPTGIDLTPVQWQRFYALFRERSLIPFLDAAYLGLGEGLDADTYAIRALARSGITGLVSNSFSKVFSLYGERVGSLSVVCKDGEIARRVAGQLKGTVRTNYSNPPRHGAELVATIFGDAELTALWRQELDAMRARMVGMRQALFDEVGRIDARREVGYLLRQKGMFSYTGLSADAVDRIREQHGVYLIRSGRMCVAGLNESNLATVARALSDH
ncbi:MULTISPECIES: aromatic amino acid transaminase [unclassified Pseudomonas]|uniref:amino acid aminotransferase n=1 Tax=unclassified Pseudomonas TaxID=196821 RepID=UPI0021CA4206|nr:MULTISPECIES: amino acid aminotransferase [unclassified Pseudomonas]MCU1733583.1 aspartate/tyrosine/aromatic aminotransferase [Pseudomonas sp. 20P_3.2_Bac4]MCU1745839.1 aspartate/tyrosine/aromatic aminotransferase [Pseudomonas sp. 20P_3.2_Bac5]